MRAVPRHRPLPLRENPAGRTLAWLASGLVCLAVIAFAVAGVAHGRLRQLAQAPHIVTVAVPPGATGAVSNDELTAAVGAMRRLPGVLQLRVVPPEELLPLLPSGAGNAQLLADLPLPRLIEIGFAPAQVPDGAALAAALATSAPEAVAGEPVIGGAAGAAAMRQLRLVGWIGGAVALVCLMGGSALVVRAALSAQRETVRLLRSLGTDEAQVARQFEQYAARNGLYGACAGFLAALAALVLLAMAGAVWPEAGLAEPKLSLADWLRLLAVPVAAALLAAAAARLTVRLGLARLG